MVQINADNPKTKALLEQICHIIEKNDGFIHPDAVITCHNNEISVSADTQDKEKALFKIPHDLMIIYDDFALSIDENTHIQIHSHIDTIKPERLKLMELMLALYNETDKLKTHLDHSIWHIFQDMPSVINLLTDTYKGEDMSLIAHYIKQGPDAQEDLALLTFFKSRLMSCALNKKNATPEGVLMPLADCMNHHPQGAFYANLYAPKKAWLSMPIARPNENSTECFAKYGTFDAMDTYLHYDFVEENVAFIRSIPLNIDLGDFGTIEIKAHNSFVAPKDIPEGFKDLRFYMPTINIHTSERRALLSHMIIPGEAAPKAMRRILSLTIDLLHPSIDTETLKTLVTQLETGILEKNLQYYEILRKTLTKYGNIEPKKNVLCEIFKRQETILERYKSLNT